MPLEVVDPELSSFKYDPSINELMVGVGHAFFFNQRSQRFELDKNPFGDHHLVPMHNVAVTHDFSQLTFDAKIQRKQQQFVIAAANDREKILLEIFARLNANGFTTRDDEADHVQLLFQKGQLSSIEIYKRAKDSEQLDSLDVFVEDDHYCLLKSRPRRKFKLNSVRVAGNKLISSSAEQEFVFRLDVQPVILEIVTRLLDGSVSPA